MTVPAPTITKRALQEQQAFRVVLAGMSRPGTLTHVEPLPNLGAHGAPASILQAMLDHEVTFAAVPGDDQVVRALLRLSGSSIASAAKADFILTDCRSLPAVLREAKTGSDEYPDRSATVVVGVEESALRDTEEGAIVLRGPGIAGERSCCIAGLSNEAIALLATRAEHLPRGLDLIFVEPGGKVLCLPRYVSVEVSNAQATPERA